MWSAHSWKLRLGCQLPTSCPLGGHLCPDRRPWGQGGRETGSPLLQLLVQKKAAQTTEEPRPSFLPPVESQAFLRTNLLGRFGQITVPLWASKGSIWKVVHSGTLWILSVIFESH